MQPEFMNRAIGLALENVTSGRGGPFAAVIVQNGSILAEGVNQVTTALDPTSHAEMNAIRNACRRLAAWQLSGCEIYTTCEPCPMCLGAIYWARLDRIYFACSREDAAASGFDDLFIYRELDQPPERRRLPARQAMRDEALEIFNVWNGQAVKTPY
ncbi:MAG: nucleoside deaminase [Bryobacterales bacterium]|nr:nucleoside deaminase [Bryobacterales bacterium]